MFLWLPAQLSCVLLETVNLPALFFVGFAFPVRGMQKSLLLLMQFHLLLALGSAGFIFPIKQNGFLGGPPLLVQIGNLNFPGILVLGDGNDIAQLDILTRFAALAVDMDFAAVNGIGRQAAGFEKPRGPQPLVDAKLGHFNQAANHSPTKP